MALKEDVCELKEVVAVLEARVDAIERADKRPKQEVGPVTPKDSHAQLDIPQDVMARELGGESEPVPNEYRGVVDTVLNKDFAIHLKSDFGKVAFSILVPKKYSVMNEEQWKMLGFDKRVKMISHAEGLDGVKLWCDRVFSSFSPPLQAQIVGDRVANP